MGAMTRKLFVLMFWAALATAPKAQQPGNPLPSRPSQAAAANPTEAQAEQTDVNAPTIKLGVNEVNLIFTVTDRHGRYNPHLQQSDFALLDNQRAPARVNAFHQQDR